MTIYPDKIMMNNDTVMEVHNTYSEVALVDITLQQAKDMSMSCVIGGLGMGFTLQRARQHPKLQHARIKVIENSPEIISLYENNKWGTSAQDKRNEIILCHDFFDFPFNPVDVILLDIDNDYRNPWSKLSRNFYTNQGIAQIYQRLYSGGVFGLWQCGGISFELENLIRNKFGNCLVTPMPLRNTTAVIYSARKEK